MSDWRLSTNDLKRYPHFDRHISLDEANALVRNPERVRANAFFPFISYIEAWRPFRKKVAVAGKKERIIRYAARRDAYIFAYYRHLLSVHYERKLLELGIEECPIAYRRLYKSDSGKGKCNIDFAKAAFDEISRHESCIAVALDISKYFESLDHDRIYQIWCELLNVERLPSDHAAVFKNITNYRVVDKVELYARLGYFGFRERNGRRVPGYLTPIHKIPTQLCSPDKFRKLVCGQDSNTPSIVSKNPNRFGIPQGAPISDLIANFYLMHFDKEINDYVSARGGRYWRYSDDILLVIPGSQDMARDARQFVIRRISSYGSEIRIKDEKTSVVLFTTLFGRRQCTTLDGREANGLEYLGFRFDGQNVFLKNKTIAGLYRKMASSAHLAARRCVKRYAGKDLQYLRTKFDYAGFLQRFGRVRDFDEKCIYKHWTFWTYVRRASQVFGRPGRGIERQLRPYKVIARHHIDEALERALQKS
jgi:hypothetical protein